MSTLKKRAFCYALALLPFVTVPATAATTGAPEIGLTLGTTGFGGSVAQPLTSRIDLRLVGTGISGTGSITANDLEINGNLGISTFGAIADYHPFRDYFAVEAGGLATNIRVAGNAVPANGAYYVVNHVAYPRAVVGTIAGLIKWTTPAPYLGIGGVPTNHSGLGFAFDLGAFYVGRATTTLTSDGALKQNAAFKRNLAAEADEITQTAGNVYPVVTLGLAYRR